MIPNQGMEDGILSPYDHMKLVNKTPSISQQDPMNSYEIPEKVSSKSAVNLLRSQKKSQKDPITLWFLHTKNELERSTISVNPLFRLGHFQVRKL